MKRLGILLAAVAVTACSGDSATAPATGLNHSTASLGYEVAGGQNTITASWQQFGEVKSYNLKANDGTNSFMAHYKAEDVLSGGFAHVFSDVPAGTYEVCLKMQAPSTQFADNCVTVAVSGAAATGAPVATSLMLTPGAATIVYGDAPSFNATLTAAGAALAGQPVTLTFGQAGNVVASCAATTDASGSASCVPADLLDAGAYDVSASFTGSADYTGSSAAAGLTLTPKALAANVGSATILLGGVAPCSITVTGWVTAAHSAQLGGAGTCTSTNLTNLASGAGTYARNYGGGLSVGSNYTIAAGATGTLQVNYGVGGSFLTPLLAAGTRTEFRAGSTVPVKFALSVAQVGATLTMGGVQVGTFRYDAAGGIYIVNLRTGDFAFAAGVDYPVVATLDTGETVQGVIRLVGKR